MVGNIKTYDAGMPNLQPEERGVTSMREAGVYAARYGREAGAAERQGGRAIAQGLESLGMNAGQVYEQYQKHEDQLAITDAGMKSADFDLAQHAKLDNIMTPHQDPNDPEKTITPSPSQGPMLIGESLTQWKADREKLRETITNPTALKAFDRETISSYNAFAKKAYSTAGHLAYQASSNALVKGVQANAQLVYNDPSQLDVQLKKTLGQVDTAAGTMNLSAEDRMKFGTSIKQKAARSLIESAVEGAARQSEAGRQWAEGVVKSGKYAEYIGMDSDKLLTHIERQRKAAASDQEAALRLQKQQQQTAALNATDEYIHDPNKKLTDMGIDPAFKGRPDLLEKAQKMVTAIRNYDPNSVLPTTSSRNLANTIHRIDMDDNNPLHINSREQIDEMFVNHELTKTDWETASKHFMSMEKGPDPADRKAARNQFIKQWAKSLDPAMGDISTGYKPSALGDVKIGRLRHDLEQKEVELAREGKDWHTLYDPSSPNYYGKHLDQYHTSLDQAKEFQKQNTDDMLAAMRKFDPASIGEGPIFPDNPVMERAGLAIKGIESRGGNYSALSKWTVHKDGTRDRAYGAYQVMGANIPSWTKEYYGHELTPQEFLHNKKAQDAVFKGEFGRLIQKYGLEGAARAWFGGPGGVTHLNRTDVYGRLTTRDYGVQFMALFHGQKHIPLGSAEPVVAPIPPGYAGPAKRPKGAEGYWHNPNTGQYWDPKSGRLFDKDFTPMVPESK